MKMPIFSYFQFPQGFSINPSFVSFNKVFQQGIQQNKRLFVQSQLKFNIKYQNQILNIEILIKQKMIAKQSISYQQSRSILGEQQCCGTLRVRRKEKAGNPSIFITKTFQILQNQQFNEIVHWNLDGNSFLIKNVQKFQQEILPIYFRHRNFTSFVRQLNMYDFHKIRNETNMNIFQHKEFRMHQKENLKSIKRKGCNEKKIQYDEVNDRFQNSQAEIIKSHKTVATSRISVEDIEPLGSSLKVNIRKPVHSPITSPFRKKLIDEFINEVPEQIISQNGMEQCIRAIKKNPKYCCLDNKQDLRKIVQKFKQTKFCKTVLQDLQDLSIEEEIIVENIRGPSFEHPSLAIFSTERFLPLRSISLIGSLNFGEDVENLSYTN